MFKKSFLLLLLSTLLFSACARSGENESEVIAPSEAKEPIKIVTTFPPLYSFAMNVVGEAGQVVNLVEPGASVHLWEPRASNLRALNAADVLVMNGLGLEPFMDDMIASAQNPNLKIVVTSEMLSGMVKDMDEPLDLGAHHDDDNHDDDHNDEAHHDDDNHDDDHDDEAHHDDDNHDDNHDDDHDDDHHGHTHEGPDPHIWLDPQLAMVQVQAIRDALISVDPENAALYQQNTQNYLETLGFLDHQIRNSLARVQKKDFIVFHDAYSYFLSRYNLIDHFKASIEPFPGREPTAAYFRNLLHLIEENRIQIVFTEPQFNPRVVHNLQEETGIRSFEIDPIGLELSAQGYENNLLSLANTFIEAFESL